MLKFTKTGIFCTLIAILFFSIQLFTHNYYIQSEIDQEIMKEINIETEKIPVEITPEKTETWCIEIPKISLNANISEGVTKEILNKYVGHFPKTSKEVGNIGLAAHNRGYEVNYFENLKLLKEGDEIRYRHNKFEKIYEVEKNRIIKDTQWEFLEETEENMLTLITCVENQPEYRRCIQALEKEEEKY